MKWIFCIAGFIALVGCQSNQSLYYYGNYEDLVYIYLKGDEKSLSEQLNLLQNIVLKTEEKGKAVAPGLHAHIGMIYFDLGDSTSGTRHLLIEKSLFPESASYIDFLLANLSGATL